MSPVPLDEVVRRARNVRLVLFDVDGVLTDGTLLISSDGTESKAFNIKDGAGIVWAQRAGLLTGLLSARPSPAAERRAADLGMTIVSLGRTDKRAAYAELIAANHLEDEHVAFMGDDLMDLPVLSRVGLAAAPADAAAEVRARVHWVSAHAGGRGAAREFVEVILRASERWDDVVRGYSA
jgi:3-deoxy-D-manno-octulosonate 8-phosphate phosphatase (KDO 8-P phosphatase)